VLQDPDSFGKGLRPWFGDRGHADCHLPVFAGQTLE